MFSGSKWGFLRTASSIVIFSTPLGVIFKVKRSYFEVKIVNFGHFCSLFTSTRARNKIYGSKWGFLRMASSIMTFKHHLGSSIEFAILKNHHLEPEILFLALLEVKNELK